MFATLINYASRKRCLKIMNTTIFLALNAGGNPSPAAVSPYVPRPFVDSVGHLLLDHKENTSFPSNHLMFMTIFATVFLLAKRIKTGLLFSLLALGIGWSRVFLGVHYPADIAGGALIGVIVSALLWRLLQPQLGFD